MKAGIPQRLLDFFPPRCWEWSRAVNVSPATGRSPGRP